MLALAARDINIQHPGSFFFFVFTLLFFFILLPLPFFKHDAFFVINFKMLYTLGIKNMESRNETFVTRKKNLPGKILQKEEILNQS